LPTIP